MKTKNSYILKSMNIIFWIIFTGLCIKTGAILTAFCVSLFMNSAGAKDLYLDLNLFDLYSYSRLYYTLIVSMFILLTGLKAYIAYLVVKLFLKFNLANPFSSEAVPLISRIGYVALWTGLLAIIASGLAKWLLNQGVNIPIDWGGSEILFFAGIIYIIATVFKKGIELQSENELTV